MISDSEITSTINSYFRFRKYKEPNAIEAFMFLITEVGETAEFLFEEGKNKEYDYPLVRMISAAKIANEYLGKGEWVRNHPNGEKVVEDIGDEVGDILMMLYKFAEKRRRSPFHAMLNKFILKGWMPDTY